MTESTIVPPEGTLEICVDDVTGLDAAIQGGADRIELCSALSVGGLTPPKGFMDLASQRGIAVSAMIRPRAGSFVFSQDEVDMMKRDIDAVREAGLSGAVLGASLASGALDTETLEALCRHAHGLDLTLHRAFDLVPDFNEALEAAISLGFSRILTSGGKLKAVDGLDALDTIMAQARGRISIMPGSGIRPDNAAGILERLKVFELHASCMRSVPCGDPQLIAFGFSGEHVQRTDQAAVAQLKAILADRLARQS